MRLFRIRAEGCFARPAANCEKCPQVMDQGFETTGAQPVLSAWRFHQDV
jgi:hypothetical protein